MYIQDLMTRNVISIHPEDPLIKAAQILFDKNFDGLPVVTHDNVLVGIVTQYDLVTKGANIHLPTFMQLLNEMPIYREDRNLLRPGLEKIVTLKVSDVMNKEPFTVVAQHTLEEVARFFGEHHRVNPIPVIDEGRRVIGIVSRYDIIKLYTGTSSSVEAISREPSLDKKVDIFVNEFEKNYVVVSKLRPLFWHIAIPIFILLGLLAAAFIILRIEIKV